MECGKGQLYDLTDRPDVERYGWDGSDIEFNVTIMWESKYLLFLICCRHRCQDRGFEFDFGNATFSETLEIKCLVNHPICQIPFSIGYFDLFHINILKPFNIRQMVRGAEERCHSAHVRLPFNDIFHNTFTFSDPLPYSSNSSSSKQLDSPRVGGPAQHEQLEHQDQLHLQRRRAQCLCFWSVEGLFWTHLPWKQQLHNTNLANLCIKYDLYFLV